MSLSSRNDATKPELLPPREEPYILKDVLENVIYGCRDEIVLDLGECCLRFKADGDDDTIKGAFETSAFRESKEYTSVASATPWKQYIGKECGWTWFAWSQQGYLDTVLISFDGIVPQVMLQTIASSIQVFTIALVENAIAAKKASPRKTKAKTKR